MVEIKVAVREQLVMIGKYVSILLLRYYFKDTNFSVFYIII